MCTVDYVRSKIQTLLSDLEISKMITETGSDVLSMCETTDETNPTVILAAKYAILAATLRKMKLTGEAPASYETPGSKVQNTTDEDIKWYQSKADFYIEKFRTSSFETYSGISSHTGFSSHCRGH